MLPTSDPLMPPRHTATYVQSSVSVHTLLTHSVFQEPSRGAKIDEQLELEEEAELRRKGKM
jgi:hypothetical protein